MAELMRTLNEHGQPSKVYRTTLNLLAERLLNENCLIFLGAGASIDKNKPHLPSAQKLSKKMAEECQLEWHKLIPLSTIAFYYESFSSRELLNAFLRGQIYDPGIEPSSTIEQLVDIIKILEEKEKKTLVISTNYDLHFETAYKNLMDRDPEVVIYRGGVDPNDNRAAKLHIGLGQYENTPDAWKPNQEACLYKMHGCISKAEGQNLVITEEDYINFLTNAIGHDENKRLLTYITGKIAFSTILFVGYSLADWNFRVIFKAVKEGIGKASYAVQYKDLSQADEREKKRWQILTRFWEEKNITILNTDASDFMGDLVSVVKDTVAAQ